MEVRFYDVERIVGGGDEGVSLCATKRRDCQSANRCTWLEENII